ALAGASTAATPSASNRLISVSIISASAMYRLATIARLLDIVGNVHSALSHTPDGHIVTEGTQNTVTEAVLRNDGFPHRGPPKSRPTVSSCGTLTVSKSHTFIMSVSRVGDLRPTCCAKTRREGSRRTLQNCRSW